jgi:hypothetical protein
MVIASGKTKVRLGGNRDSYRQQRDRIKKMSLTRQ